MNWKISSAIVFVLTIVLIMTGCAQKPVPEAIKNCNEILAADWNEGFQCVLDLGSKVQKIDDCRELNNLESPEGKLTDFQSICIMKFAIYKEDASVCPESSSFSDKETNAYRNTCIVEVAAAKKDQTLCSQVISDEGIVGKGTTEYNICMASAAQNEDECAKIEDENTRFGCIEVNAERKLDETVCEIITESTRKNACIWQIARLKKDWTVCNKIIEEQFGHRNICVKDVAYDLLDGSICGEAGNLREQCLSSIEEYKDTCRSCDPSTGVICPKKCEGIV